MERVLAEQVQSAIQERGVKQWRLRTCGICNAPLHYFFHAGFVSFDSNCDCTSYWAEPKPRPYADIADMLNMQTPEVRARMWSEMLGLEAEPDLPSSGRGVA